MACITKNCCADCVAAGVTIQVGGEYVALVAPMFFCQATKLGSYLLLSNSSANCRNITKVIVLQLKTRQSNELTGFVLMDLAMFNRHFCYRIC